MRRLFWISLGASVGVIVVWRLRSTMNSWTPDGIANRTQRAWGGFWGEVSDAAAQREAELREALGIEDEGP